LEHARFTYRSLKESESRFLDDLEGFLDAHRIQDDMRHKILLAASEAFTNALIHGNGYDPQKEIVVQLAVNDSGLSADIIDQGREGAQRIKLRQPSGPLAENGRGIDLISHYASTCEFRETETGGMKASMTFNFAAEEETQSK